MRTYKIETGEQGMKLMNAAFMHKWFKHLFEQRMDSNGYVRCFECGLPMSENAYKTTTTCYSHLLGKKQYPQHAGDPANIVIVHPDCHNLYTMKPQAATHQYAEYLRLKELYNI